MGTTGHFHFWPQISCLNCLRKACKRLPSNVEGAFTTQQPECTSFCISLFGLYASLIRNKSLGREGSLRMLWPHHSRSILFQNTSYFKIFGHLEAVFHGAFHLIKQKRVPLKSTGRNINSPVKKKRGKERKILIYFDPSFIRVLEITKTNKLLICAWETSVGSCP